MKNPCELIIWYVLPDLRSEITKNLIETYGIKQTKASDIFGVTRAAINQYISSKRGSVLFSIIKNKNSANILQKEIKTSAKRIYENNSSANKELCRICSIIRNSNMIYDIYEKYEHSQPPPDCYCNFEQEIQDVNADQSTDCPHCGSDIKTDWKACPTCGKKLFNSCPKCKKDLEPNWKACPYCGKMLFK